MSRLQHTRTKNKTKRSLWYIERQMEHHPTTIMAIFTLATVGIALGYIVALFISV